MRRVEWVDGYLLSIIVLMRFVAKARSTHLRDLIAWIAGNTAYYISRQKRTVSQQRLAMILGEKTNTRRNAYIARETFHVFWEDLLRLALPERDLSRVKVSGLEHIGTALVNGHGAVLLENSLFGQRHLATQILFGRGISVHQVHVSSHLGGLDAPGETQVRSRFVQPYFEACERKFVDEIIYLRENNSLAFTRRLAEVLQNNQVLCLSGEGQFSARPITLTFLGSERKFATGAISLAKLTGAPVLPMYCWRDSSNHLELMIEPPLALEAGMRPYVEQLETYVRRSPEQYRGWPRAD
jgi:lauroyl/myristoyl acyltransferase